HAAILMNMEPVFTIALAMLLLGEQFDRQQVAGAALVIAAVFTVTHTKTARVERESV
ncbi:MAG: EamA family transporter, partial [Proteobacteria bacterium]|nr:EamA family transporter [Pseudomonadota bacterium]